ncbi:MAG: 6-phosphogluconolactonase [bacterium]|nr:6-phosphogluconolactonase [bacterium]
MATTGVDVRICKNLEVLSLAAGEAFVGLAEESVKRSGRFSVALAGGSTPRGLYGVLASPGFRDRIPWQKVHLFWGDERCVPPDHKASNYRMVRKALLLHIQIPQENIHPMPGELEPGKGAARYERELRAFFPDHQFPVFDLLLLGLGQDGHTASLFPGSPALGTQDRWVVPAHSAETGTDRITLTLSVLNHGVAVFFLVAGESKASILKEVLCEDHVGRDLPARLVRPADGRVTWFVDERASEKLARS